GRCRQTSETRRLTKAAKLLELNFLVRVPLCPRWHGSNLSRCFRRRRPSACRFALVHPGRNRIYRQRQYIVKKESTISMIATRPAPSYRQFPGGFTWLHGRSDRKENATHESSTIQR